MTQVAIGGLLDVVNLFLHLRLLRLVELKADWMRDAALQPNTPYRSGFLASDDILAHAKDPENRLYEELVAIALKKGDRCFGIIDGNTLASFGWYSILPTRIGRNMLFCFPQEYVYMYHGFTRPAYRGQRLHSLGLARATLSFIQEGYAGVVSLLEPTNWASRASAYKLGFRPFGTIFEVGFRRALRYYVTPLGRARGCYVKCDPTVPAGTSPRTALE